MELIKKIGNERAAIEAFYETIQQDYVMEKTIVCKFASELFKTSGRDASFAVMQRDDSCDKWHIDGSGKQQLSMIISSFPNPTEILIPRPGIDKLIERRTYRCDYEIKELQQLIKDGAFDLFTPEPGDIYWLAPGVIHRTNPKAIGNKHLVLRVWNPIMGESL